jgi:hypothetical protein
LDAIRVRHDIVHRYGFTKDGDTRRIDPGMIEQTIAAILQLVETIDRQVIERYAALF